MKKVLLWFVRTYMSLLILCAVVACCVILATRLDAVQATATATKTSADAAATAANSAKTAATEAKIAANGARSQSKVAADAAAFNSAVLKKATNAVVVVHKDRTVGVEVERLATQAGVASVLEKETETRRDDLKEILKEIKDFREKMKAEEAVLSVQTLPHEGN